MSRFLHIILALVAGLAFVASSPSDEAHYPSPEEYAAATAANECHARTTTATNAVCPDAERVHELELQVMELEILLAQTQTQLEAFLKNESNFQCPYGSNRANEGSKLEDIWRTLSGGPAAVLPSLKSAARATWRRAALGWSELYRTLPEEWQDMLEDAVDTVISQAHTAAYFASKRKRQWMTQARRALKKQGLI